MLGAGSWGTALAIALASRFDRIHIWAHHPGRANAIEAQRENTRYLPGSLLPDNITVSSNLGLVVAGAPVVLSAVPSAYLRDALAAAKPFLVPNVQIVSATKGLEDSTLCRMSQVISQALNGVLLRPVAVLSGPTFAREIAAGEPAALVVACADQCVCEQIQSDFSTAKLRLYASNDVVGTELGAALKNVIALGAGICCGLGLGSNSVAALITRGLAEISRLAVAMGGNPRTLSGLAGLGDLVLTATGDLSRNRFVGIQLGKGLPLDEILQNLNMVAEGVGTCRAAYQLGLNQHVELPIVNRMYEVLYESKDPRQALQELMERPLKME